ncbi:hypothetical protein BT69DRAFT_175216 [Atractiella rhizophila]|nr:hypothetical protein BT69DRAFT_175216 [Atractiella rhizophila]
MFIPLALSLFGFSFSLPLSANSARAGCANLSVNQLLAIAPSTAVCNSSATFAAECRTADEAVPYINESFKTYAVESEGEVAALISLMLFETGNLRFEKNHFPAPGRPGQGTRNLMMFNFVYDYALSIPETRDAALALCPFPPDSTSDDPTSPTYISPDTKNAVLALVLPDTYSFASAAWFLKTKCPAEVSELLKEGGCAGFQAYIGAGCIGTTDPDGRGRLDGEMRQGS